MHQSAKFYADYTSHCRKQHHLEQHHQTIELLLSDHHGKQRSIQDFWFSL